MLLVPVEVSPFSEMYQSFNSLILGKPDFLTIAENSLPIDLSKTGGGNKDYCNNCESLQKCHLESFSDSLTYFKGSDLSEYPSIQRSLTGSLWNWVKNQKIWFLLNLTNVTFLYINYISRTRQGILKETETYIRCWFYWKMLGILNVRMLNNH